MPRSLTSPPSSRSSRWYRPAKTCRRKSAAINNFIDSGFDAIVVNAQNPTAFGPVIKRAKDAGVVLVAFDNILDTQDAINVNVDQKGLGELWAQWLVDHIPDGGKVLEVRGVAGTSVDTDRHDGIHEVLDASGKQWDVTEVMGKWDDGTAQKVTADAIATNGPFVGITGQGGDTGIVQAMLDASHPMVPFGGETENGFRKFCAKFSDEGLKCTSARHRPGSGGGGDQDRDRGARGTGRAAVGEVAVGCRIRPPKGGRGLLPGCSPTTSSSATPSRAAASISRRRRSWASPRKTNRLKARVRRRGVSLRGAVLCAKVRPGEGRMDDAQPLLRMEGVSKRYGGVHALEGADLVVTPGRIHAILGENGAGKSTLIKIMAGVVAPDEGKITFEGREVTLRLARRGQRRRHRLHLPGVVADP